MTKYEYCKLVYKATIPEKEFYETLARFEKIRDSEDWIIVKKRDRSEQILIKDKNQ